MFKLFDDFTAYDENKQPYTFSVERHTETANLHSGVTECGFALKSIGNRYILNSPRFTTGVFCISLTVSYPYEIDPVFQMIFGYDEETRTGLGLQFTYVIGGSLSVCPISVKNGTYTPLAGATEKGLVLRENEFLRLRLELCEKCVVCRVGDAEFSFDIKNRRGRLAIDRGAFIGELIIREFSFETAEEFESNNIVGTPRLAVPLINGGDIPYTIQYGIDAIDGEYYLTAKLDGGTKSRERCKSERLGQYVAEVDYMTAPYVGLADRYGDVIFNISSKENCFVDPNIFWDCQKIFFGDIALPIECAYKIRGLVPDEVTELIFGYRELNCKGYAQQAGGCEFRFSREGALLYCGPAKNGEGSYSLISPPDKVAVSLIPSDCAEYENILAHLKNNHYFSASENIEFSLLFRTEIRPCYLEFVAAIKDVFERDTVAVANVVKTAGSCTDGVGEVCCKAVFEPLPVGVYKIVFTILYGGAEYRTVSHAFEVYDESSDVCPPTASGLPFMFTMNNEQKKLARNGFDLSNPMPSCDLGHYIACATTTPVEAERQEIWKYIKLFGRKWFAWLAIRTCDDYLSPKHDVTVKNSDYLFNTAVDTSCDPLGAYSLYPNRVDHWWRHFYTYPGVRSLISDFFADAPELLEKTGYTDGEDLTEECYEKIVALCGRELMEYINRRKHALVAEHNSELKKINPNVKRAVYGPIPPYYNPTLTYHSLKFFGLPEDEELCREYYSGFAIFEDYPFSCSYQTYRGPFAVMTLLLHCPELTLYPELYVGSRGGCIDGAVKYAHAPMGDYDCPPYQNLTLAFEYVYNTAYKTKDGFAYWNTYGFHRGLCTNEYINEFVKGWWYVHRYKPVRPLRSVAYIAEYSGDDDIYRRECNYYNRSESGQTVVYECAREAGIPNGFGVSFDLLGTLSEDDCDLLILPSLANADAKAVAEIRRLYDAGVGLIAVSDVSGFEDIFGVEVCRRSETVTSVEYMGEKEYVYNTEGDFAYAPSGAQVEFTANGSLPVIITTERTAIINTALVSLGCADKTKMCDAKGAFIVGGLIRRALSDITARLSSPIVFGKNVGVTVFEDECGRRVLFAVDHTLFDNRVHGTKEAVVELCTDDVTDVVSDIAVRCGRVNGKVKELRFDILPHGTAFIELVSK